MHRTKFQWFIKKSECFKETDVFFDSLQKTDLTLEKAFLRVHA